MHRLYMRMRGASADDVAAALSALETAEKNLAELISPIYMTDFVSCENGRVTVELNGPTNYVPDGETKWTYEYRDGRHLCFIQITGIQRLWHPERPKTTGPSAFMI